MGLFNKFIKKNNPKEEDNPQENRSVFKDWCLESFLRNEAKFRHQQKVVKRSSKNEPVTLEYILKELLNVDPSDCGAMTIVSREKLGHNEKTEVIENPSDVLAYKPYDAILYTNDKGEVLPIKGKNTVLIISYRPSDIVYGGIEKRNDKSKLRTDNSIIMFLRGIGPFMYETAYMRVSIMIPNFTSPDDFRVSHSKNAPFTTSFILGFDLVSPEDKLNRYKDVEASLIRKLNKGEKLSQDEQAVREGLTYSKDLISDFNEGCWLVSEKRYADALMPLMNAYNYLKTAIVTEYDNLHSIFHETCFNIGFCLNEMEQYDRAIYYFDLIPQKEKSNNYIIEYINALVNSGDPRSMGFVQDCLSEFEEGKKQVDSEETSMFYDFLWRRLAYLFIDYKMWDDARELLEGLKKRPSCHDFAISELEYIKSVTGK